MKILEEKYRVVEMKWSKSLNKNKRRKKFELLGRKKQSLTEKMER